MINPSLTNAEQIAGGSMVVGGGSSAPSVQCSFDDGEFTDTTGAPSTKKYAIDFNVPSILPKRKFYGGLWSSNNTPAENWVRVRIDLWRNGTQLGWFPWAVGTSAALLQRALPSLLIAGGNPDPDCMLITLDSPQAWATSPQNLQPFCFSAEIDRITASIDELKNITNIKLYLACFSSAPSA